MNARAPRAGASIVALALAAASVAALAGCSPSDALQAVGSRLHTEQFETRAEAADGWRGVAMPPWLPGDAHGIRNVATNDELDSAVRVESAEPLPLWCVATERMWEPDFDEKWIPRAFPERIEQCGDYEVMRVPGGYLGWFHGVEPGQRPHNATVG